MGLRSYINNRTYSKPYPFRDATLFVVVCEGSKREPNYFNFFHTLTPKIRIKAVGSSSGMSAPQHLISNAYEAMKEIEEDGDFELWFVLDIDDWSHSDLINITKECSNKNSWYFAFSNPCFEVWLYLHFEKTLYEDNKYLERCNQWKQEVVNVSETEAGFDCDRHPTLIANANQNSKECYKHDGYFPTLGATQLHFLGTKIYELTKDKLEEYYS